MTQLKNLVGIESHCLSCHQDQELGFPRNEFWDYGNDYEKKPPPEKRYCCCEQERIGNDGKGTA